MAAQIASQLPEAERDALTVLNYTREIVCNLGRGWEVPSAMPQTKDSIKLVSLVPRKDRGAH